jgi:hypothetical protein
MSLDLLASAFEQLPAQVIPQVATKVARFVRLADDSASLQPYVEQLLPSLADLFGAQAGMIWLRAHGSAGACFAMRYRADTLNWDARAAEKHDRLVQLGWHQRQPMLVEPHSATGVAESSSPSANPTGFRLVFGPVIHLGEPLALIEMLITGTGAVHPNQRRAYLRAMQLAIEQVHSGLLRRLGLSVGKLTEAHSQLQQLEEEIRAYQHSIRKCIESRLRQFQGWTFGSLAENQKFAKLVHQLLDEHGLRVQCPECGHAAILRCLGAGNSKHGVFVFDHYLEDGRTFHGGPTTFPAIVVVPKPARRSST